LCSPELLTKLVQFIKFGQEIGRGTGHSQKARFGIRNKVGVN